MATAGSYQQPPLPETFAQAAAAVKDLLGRKDSLLEPLEDGDNFPTDDFVFYLQLWDQLLSSATAADSLTYAPTDANASSYWISQHMLWTVISSVQSIPGLLQALTDLENTSLTVKNLISQMEGCIRRAKAGNLDGVPQLHKELILDLVGRLEESIQEHRRRQLDSLTIKAREAAQSAESSAASASTAAGVTGEVVLSSHYDTLATEELTRANRFRTSAIGTAIGAAAATAAFVLGPEFDWAWAKIGSTDYVHLLQRVLLIGALIGVAGYLSRQAHHHRATANWAKALSVQLKTFNAFIAPMGNQKLAEELRREFGARVFGEHPAMKGEPTVTPSAAAMDTAVGWAAKLTAGGK